MGYDYDAIRVSTEESELEGHPVAAIAVGSRQEWHQSRLGWLPGMRTLADHSFLTPAHLRNLHERHLEAVARAFSTSTGGLTIAWAELSDENLMAAILESSVSSLMK